MLAASATFAAANYLRMPQTAAELLNELQNRALVPAGVLASLQSQVAKAAKPVTPAAIAKLLVEKGHLTAAQAQQLLTASAAPTPPVMSTGTKSSMDDLAPLDDLRPLDDLQPLDDLPLENLATDDLAPLDEVQPLEELQPLEEAAPSAAVIPLDDLGALDPLAPASSAKAAPGKSRTSVAAAQGKTVAPADAMAATAPLQPTKRTSPLVLVATVLVVMVVIGGGAAGAFLLIPRGGGEEAFAAAESDYQSKQYDAAVAKLEAFLTDYPASDRASAARVQLAAAKVFAARASSPQSWQSVLAVAKDALPPVAALPEFSEVQGEIAPLVMDMAAALADDAAKSAATSEHVSAAREALALANDGRIVPANVRQWQRLELAADNVAVSAYSAERAKVHDAGVAAIKQAAAAGDVEAALAERAKLLAAYPDLAGDSSLRDAGLALATGIASKVESKEYSAAAKTAERKTGIVGSVTLVTPLKATTASEAGPPVAVDALGSVWGLDSATGRLLWRRGGAGQSVRLATEAASDLLVVEDSASELLRVEARSGKLLWRHHFAGPLAGLPLIVGNRVVATTRSGQVHLLDVQSGAGQMLTQLPVRARVGAIADATAQHLIQVADHSLLYVLAAADLACQRAVYVGHEPAAVVVPPTLLPKHLVMGENRGSATSTLHVLVLDSSGLPERVVQHIELAGHVLAPPVVLSGKLLVTTDAGRVTAYESAADPISGLKEVAKAEAGTRTDIARYPLVASDKLLVAGQGLSQFAPPISGTLKSIWSAIGDDVLIGPPQQLGDTIVTLRRPTGKSGVIAAGISAADGKVRWETCLGERAQSIDLTSDRQSLAVTTTSGATSKAPLADFTGNKVVALAPTSSSQAGTSATEPVERLAWREGQIVISPAGMVSCIDPASGSLKAEPLLLRLKPGARLDACRAAAAGDKGAVLAISNGRDTLSLVNLAGEGGLQLVELASARLTSPPISGLAVGDGAIGLVDRRGQLVTYSVPDLQPGATLDLGASAIVAGPTRVGDFVILATDRGELVGLDRALAQAWRVPLSRGAPAGDLGASGADAVLASCNGWLCKLDGTSGREVAAVDLGQPLAGTPLVIGGEAIVATADGAILKVALPAQSEGTP